MTQVSPKRISRVEEGDKSREVEKAFRAFLEIVFEFEKVL